MELFDKSLLPQKVNLSGPDCFHLVLDKHAQKHNAGGNVMRIVFYFDTKITARKAEDILNRSPVIHWLCNIKLVAGYLFQLPYWKYKDEARTIIVAEHNHTIENEIPANIIHKDIPLTADRFITVDIIHYPGDRSALVLSWNHIHMDGRGISLLVAHLNDISNNTFKIKNLFPRIEKRIAFFRQIKNMYAVKRFIEASSRLPISSVAEVKSKSVQHFKNKIIYFTPEESVQLENNAFKNGARFGANLFYLACCAHTVNKINLQKNKKGVIWIPIPYDGRLKGSTGPIISNHVAFLFYRLQQDDLAGIKQTIASLNKQMAEQLQIEMPRKYNMLLGMMRRIPLWLYYFLINRTAEGSFASFLYSSTGNNFNDMESLFNERVKHLTIFPSSTFPPGLTFSFLKHGGALNINIAYSPDIISNIELDTIKKELRNLLLANY